MTVQFKYFHDFVLPTYFGRKLKIQWTPEIAQDLVFFHGIDAEQELINILRNEIQNEISFPRIVPAIGRTIAQELVSVQPLPPPTGIIWYFGMFQINKTFKYFHDYNNILHS